VKVRVRHGDDSDLDAAVAVFIDSNLARRHGTWPHKASSVARLEACLRKPGSWLFVAEESSAPLGMAATEPMRGEGGTGAVIPGGLFLGYLYVVPGRWGEGIGGLLLDAVLASARRHDYRRVHLWTHEDNDRSHGLYRSRGFRRTGRVVDGEGEWASDFSQVPPASDAFG
jgi:GNAT superfamily N-acetyltransferase